MRMATFRMRNRSASNVAAPADAGQNGPSAELGPGDWHQLGARRCDVAGLGRIGNGDRRIPESTRTPDVMPSATGASPPPPSARISCDTPEATSRRTRVGSAPRRLLQEAARPTTPRRLGTGRAGRAKPPAGRAGGPPRPPPDREREHRGRRGSAVGEGGGVGGSEARRRAGRAGRRNPPQTRGGRVGGPPEGGRSFWLLLSTFFPEGLRPSDSPTRSLARRCAGALRSRGSLARSPWSGGV